MVFVQWSLGGGTLYLGVLILGSCERLLERGMYGRMDKGKNMVEGWWRLCRRGGLLGWIVSCKVFF